MSRYTVTYQHPRLGTIHDVPPDNWTIAHVREGFWVGALGVISPPMDESVYWIPPHRVEYVKLNGKG